MNDVAEIKFQILQLDKILGLCTQLIEADNIAQKDETLLKILKDEYTLSKEDTDLILEAVAGKKKTEAKQNVNTDAIKAKLDAFCITADVVVVDRKGEALTYQQLKNKVASKKSTLNRTLKEDSVSNTPIQE